MHYKAIAIIDSENSLLKDKVDGISDEAERMMNSLNKKWEDDSLDQILDEAQNLPPEMQLKSALLKHFEDILKTPLRKLAREQFEDYTIEDIFSVDKLLGNIESKNYDIYPEAILTSRCEWIKKGWSGNHKKDQELSKEWDRTVLDILNENRKKGIVVLIDCNI